MTTDIRIHQNDDGISSTEHDTSNSNNAAVPHGLGKIAVRNSLLG